MEGLRGAVRGMIRAAFRHRRLRCCSVERALPAPTSHQPPTPMASRVRPRSAQHQEGAPLHASKGRHSLHPYASQLLASR